MIYANTRHRYQVSVYRTIGPLVFFMSCWPRLINRFVFNWGWLIKIKDIVKLKFC